MQHLGKISWNLIDFALEDEPAFNLELDSSLHRKPVKSVSYIGRDRVIFEFAKHEEQIVVDSTVFHQYCIAGNCNNPETNARNNASQAFVFSNFLTSRSWRR